MRRCASLAGFLVALISGPVAAAPPADVAISVICTGHDVLVYQNLLDRARQVVAYRATLGQQTDRRAIYAFIDVHLHRLTGPCQDVIRDAWGPGSSRPGVNRGGR